jgi:hypothetical protein
MKTNDITLIFKVILDLKLNMGIIMEANDQSIAIVKRKDPRGVYYSINDTINNVPQEQHHDSCPMTLLLYNVHRFKYPVYKSRITQFM